MLPATIVRALTTPAFEPDQFVATKWSTAEDKAKFANALMKFIAQEFPRPDFSKALYQRLSNTFGHIAHTMRRVLFRLLRARRRQGGLPRPDASLALLRRSDLHILRCRARRPAALESRERDRSFPHARGRCDPQARARCARSLASEIRREPRACLVLAANLAAAGRPVRGMTRSTAEEARKRRKKHGTPVRRKGWVRPAADAGPANPGASRRLCPGRIARALADFVFEEDPR